MLKIIRSKVAAADHRWLFDTQVVDGGEHRCSLLPRSSINATSKTRSNAKNGRNSQGSQDATERGKSTVWMLNVIVLVSVLFHTTVPIRSTVWSTRSSNASSPTMSGVTRANYPKASNLRRNGSSYPHHPFQISTGLKKNNLAVALHPKHALSSWE